MTARPRPRSQRKSRSKTAARASLMPESRSATSAPRLSWRRRREGRATTFDRAAEARMRARGQVDVAAGEAILAIENVSLAFGGVKALTDVSFDIRKGEIRAIIGPNGAGKTSMLNVVNGFCHPNQGYITFKGKTRSRMQPYEASRGGIARTFQNVALFKGMS